MVLVLAVHTVEEVSARIPFCMMVLSRQVPSVPPGIQSRFLIPTSGTKSVSLWDASDVETLKAWLDETLSEYCVTECYEAVEEFGAFLAGLGVLRSSRRLSLSFPDISSLCPPPHSASVQPKASRWSSRAAG